MKKIIILKDSGGRLANQLWNFASVYSYCLDRNYECRNYVFFRYQYYFDCQPVGWLYKLFLHFYALHRSYKLGKVLNFIYYKIVTFIFQNRIVSDENIEFNLPPSINKNEQQQNVLKRVENKKDGTYYFSGWLFRNPDGLIKYRIQIREFFKPKEIYFNKVSVLGQRLRQRYKLLVGVHVRQGDYKIWRDGRFYFSGPEVAKILNDFIDKQEISRQDACFVICSDGPIEVEDFAGLNIIRGPGSEIADLYMLSETDLIIGSNSTYGTWAAYFGQIPFYQFSKQEIDWRVKNIPC